MNTSDSSGTTASSPSATVAKSSDSISPETAAVLVAVIIPTVVIAIVVICFFQIQKHWKIRKAEEAAAVKVNTGVEPRMLEEGVHLYLQHKAELGVEQTGSGMRAEEEIYEMMDRDQCQELPGEESRHHMLSLEERHELRGEDPARELDVLPDQQNRESYSFEEPRFEELNELFLTLHKFP